LFQAGTPPVSKETPAAEKKALTAEPVGVIVIMVFLKTVF
jgi:hypothetical protein